MAGASKKCLSVFKRRKIGSQELIGFFGGGQEAYAEHREGSGESFRKRQFVKLSVSYRLPHIKMRLIRRIESLNSELKIRQISNHNPGRNVSKDKIY